jgi:hypothetical protein
VLALCVKPHARHPSCVIAPCALTLHEPPSIRDGGNPRNPLLRNEAAEQGLIGLE